jgi:integrase
MPRASKTGNVRKICGCTRWKECPHAWYVWAKSKARGQYRKNLDLLIDRHCVDIEDAKREARRALVAWESGRDVADLLPGDRPTVASLLAAYRRRAHASPTEALQAGPIERAVVAGRPFGTHRAKLVTREHLESFRRQRPAVGANRDLALLRAAYNYAVLGGVLTSSPFKVGTITAVKLAREESRTRRLQGGEEARLLLACRPTVEKIGDHKQSRPYEGNALLEALITAALETGCRKGELLSLQWSQVAGDLFLPAGKTKAKKARRVPISSTLRGVLDTRRRDPAGELLPPTAYVFGDEIGRRHNSITKAWRLACARAKIDDLHFHDLRREAGSRWLDAGVPLSTIQKWLGHANISQTSTYLVATQGGDTDAMRLFEERMGRVPPLPLIAPKGISDGSNGTPSDPREAEKPRKNANGPGRPTVH